MQRGRKREDYDYRTKLSNSQNFITNKRLIQRIVNISGICKADTVIEIGTGKGHLTEELCKKGRLIYSIELDNKLYQSSKVKLEKFANLNLIYGDFLQYRLPSTGDYRVFANIPYSITTQIVDRLTNASNPAADIWLIMEKGAAKRFMGKSKETETSLLLKVNWEMKIVYYFRREDFHPMPSVDSVMVHFSRKPTPDLNRKEREEFRKFIRISQRYGFGSRQSLLTKRQADIALKQAGPPHAHEDGVTLYIQWLCLFRCYMLSK